MANDKKNFEPKESELPEGIPVIPINVQLEREKEERRKLEKQLRDKGKQPEPIVTTQSGKTKLASQLTPKEREIEIIRCATDAIYFIKTYLTIFDQTKGGGGQIIFFDLFPFQERLIEDYQEHRFVIANKYRQAGISTTTCAYITWYIMFNENRSVAIVANKLETAVNELMNDVVDFIDSCPKWLRPNPTAKDTQKLKRYDNGCELGAFSSKGLRGYTPTLLFWDETAWTEKGDKFWTSANPTLQTGGRAIMVSCVTKDSYIFTDKGIKQVKDFILNENLGANTIDNINLLGANKTRKSNILFNNGYVDTLKISTSYNEIECSKQHKFWTYKNGKYSWIESKDLEIGDYVSIQTGMEIWGDNDDCSDFEPYISGKIRNHFKPNKITTDIAYLIGLYLSEGYAYKVKDKENSKTLTITCGDDITEILDNLKLKYYCKDGLHYKISNTQLVNFLEYMGFDITKKAKEKIIPKRVLEMGRENIIAMIQGIMDGDGYTTYDKKNNRIRVGIQLASPEFIKQMRILFNNFGILTDYKEGISKPTKKVKVESNYYSISIYGTYARKYFKEIGFRFDRKNNKIKEFILEDLKHVGVHDNIPNGSDILKKLFKEVKYRGIHKQLKEEEINVKDVVQKNKGTLPVSRKTILRFIKLFKDKFKPETLKKYKHIINENIVWTKIKTIEQSKNWTYDFSMSNDNPIEDDEFNMSIIYNQFLTHNTPNGLDPVYYKTFTAAKRKENNFKAVELWWFNDPRYNKDLVWIKNKEKENEIRMPDEGWSDEHRIKLQDDGWEANSPWLEEQIRQANGDMKKVAQEILCVFGDSIITVRHKETKQIINIRIDEFYELLAENDN